MLPRLFRSTNLFAKKNSSFQGLLSSSSMKCYFHNNQFMKAVNMDTLKQLRADTDAPLGLCRKALEENNGELDKAKEWLRQKGLQTAAKKSSRATAEGVISIAQHDNKRAVLLEVNSETDFVVNSERFKQVVEECSNGLVKVENLSKREYAVEIDENVMNNEILENKSIFDNQTIKDKLHELVGVLRENVKIRRVKVLENKDTENVQLVGYLHNAKTESMGGSASLVLIKSLKERDVQTIQSLGRQVAMHICGMTPNYLTKEQVPDDVIEYERNMLRKRLEEEKEQAEREGKVFKERPKDIVDKMIEGQLNKQFFGEYVLLAQPWVLDQKITVEQFCKDEGVQIIDFVRMKVGEGLQISKKSFAEEVAEQAKTN
ncbi:hypothetical protein ABK040_002376 [Willaertia magna]